MFKSFIIIEFEQSCAIETKTWFEKELKDHADLLTKFSDNSKGQVIFQSNNLKKFRVLYKFYLSKGSLLKHRCNCKTTFKRRRRNQFEKKM